MRTRIGTSLAALALSLCALTGSASAGVTCNLVASPSGSDAASGTVAAPFQTAQKLADSLVAGQTGCLRAGSYREDLRVGVGGRQGARVTLTSYPGETATVVGRLWVARGADYVTVTHLHLVGVNSDNLPSPSLNANHLTFSYDDVTNDHTAICFDIGSHTWGTSAYTVITRNRIHDCGVLPPTNHQHGIYLQAGTYTRITWNIIDHNADRGIQLYPDAQYTTIAHNIIDHNGADIDFSGDDGVASNDANVYGNILSNATVRYDVESWYPDGNPIGARNVMHNNCIWGGQLGTVSTESGGFQTRGNTFAAPQFNDPAAGGYALPASSPCLRISGDVQAAVEGTPPTTPTGLTVRLRRVAAHAAAAAHRRTRLAAHAARAARRAAAHHRRRRHHRRSR